MTPFLIITEIVCPFFPALFILHQAFDQIGVIFQLRIDHFYIFIILSEEITKVLKRSSDFLT